MNCFLACFRKVWILSCYLSFRNRTVMLLITNWRSRSTNNTWVGLRRCLRTCKGSPNVGLAQTVTLHISSLTGPVRLLSLDLYRSRRCAQLNQQNKSSNTDVVGTLLRFRIINLEYIHSQFDLNFATRAESQRCITNR